MLRMSVDVGLPTLADRLCSFGITEVAAAVIAGGLADAGVGAATAGIISSVAAPALVGSATGALTSAVTGGKPLKGALFGGLTGGALGGLGAAFPETMSSIGLGPAMASKDAAGNWTPGAGGFPSSAGVLPGDNLASAANLAAGLDPATAAAYGVPSEGGGALSNPLTDSSASAAKGPLSSLFGGGGGGAAAGSPNLGRGIIAAALTAMGNRQTAPNYGITPGPGTTAATRGPYFDKPLQSSGYINRSTFPNYQPQGGDWYHYGQQEQPQFFQNNQLTFAKGGPLSFGKRQQAPQQPMQPSPSPFDTSQGDSYVDDQGDGSGGGQDDKVPAALSPGEFVMDASTVSRLGGGSNREGARRLEKMRRQVARHAGSKHVVPPKPKAPMSYLRHAAGGR